MHAKTLIFDERVVLSGSVNMTHNGFEKNKKHLWRITEPSAVAEAFRDFEDTWKKATVIGKEEVQLMMEKHDARERKKKSSSSKSEGANESETETPAICRWVATVRLQFLVCFLVPCPLNCLH
jgi:phosphatidylserine/phosphatidylglycerophosphate/cardiolipin synthase-like enzyme